MKWVEVKMKELGVLSNPSYKITALMDHGAMITISSGKRVFDCKPLGVIWGKFPEVRLSASEKSLTATPLENCQRSCE
jgi:ubiquitin-like domain-containing CTD phosphatase 1